MALLSKKQILGAKDIKTAEVEVPEWGGSVLVKGLSGKERDKYEKSLYVMSKNGRDFEFNIEYAKVKLIVLGTIDENGDKLFEQADVEALAEKNASALDRVFTKIQELSGLKAGDIEEAVKN